MINFIKKYCYIIIIIILFSIILIESYIIYNNYGLKTNNETYEQVSLYMEEEINHTEEDSSIKVDIKGAVLNPGVYVLSSGSIINDAILLAGGFKNNAYKNNINLSKKLKDEMVVYVFSKSEYQKLNENSSQGNQSNCIAQVDISSCVNKGISVITSTDEEIQNTESIIDNNQTSVKVNINTATKEELMSISGIGESKANSIIEYRNKNGLFTSIQDITNVSGIGQSMYDKIKDYITV